jgi:hypothetical protein
MTLAKRIRQVLLVLLLVELIYLLLVNTALYLPVTQDLVNRLRPDKFQVSWERAWSWYPTRVHVRGLAMDGQSRSQQWQAAAPEASASIALLPLVAKRVWLSDVRATDIDYRQRPRLKPDKDYSRRLPHFPAIADREVVPVGEYNTKKSRPWHIAVDGISISGEHRFWVYQLRGAARGEASGSLTYRTRGGPFSLDVDHLELALDPVYVSTDVEVISGGSVSGELGFAPFVPRENKGAAVLRYLRTDARVDLAMNDLSFLDLFLLNLPGVTVDGAGRVAGTLNLDQGTVLAPTDLSVDAGELQVTALSHRIRGSGAARLAMDDAALGEGLYLGFHYEDLRVHPQDESADVLTGEGLDLVIRGDGYLLPRAAGSDPSRSLGVNVDSLSVPDLARLQRYLPTHVPLQLHGGLGTLDGRVELRPTALSADVTLHSDDADLSVRDYRFATDLAMGLKLDNADLTAEPTAIGGSYLRLSGSRIARLGRDDSAAWDTAFSIDDGYVSLSGPPEQRDADNARDLLHQLDGLNASERLAQLWAQLRLSASMSNLKWIAALIERDHRVGVDGSGALAGDIHIVDGRPDAPSRLQLNGDDLTVSALDYVSRGDGEVVLEVQRGAPDPRWSLAIDLRDADLKREGDDLSYIEDVQLSLSALLARSGEEDKPLRADELTFRIDTARVTDMAAFNSYLPQDGSIAFSGGSADLTANIRLKPEDADGWVKLDAVGAQAQVSEQTVRGDLLVDVQLVAGVPRMMAFDISGSRLLLDNVHVEGERAEFDGDYWSAQFQLDKGRAIWRRPVRLRAEGVLDVSDSRPFVTLLENRGWRPKILSRILTIEDIRGQATVSAADEVLYLEDVHVLSDNVEFAARGSLAKSGRDAMVYLRYKGLDALLKYAGQERNLDIINARETFDAFQPDVPPVEDGSP